MKNDKIIKINGENINEDVSKLVQIIQEKGLNTMTLIIQRNKQ